MQIKLNPSGAQILLDGQDKGETDKGVWQNPGSYRLKLIKPGYVEINKTINVTETGTNTFNYNLEKNSGSLNLSVTPNGAKVLINKEDYTSTGAVQSSKMIELAPGRYKIELSKTGYNPQSETITIVRGQTLRKTYTLLAKTGKLRFSIQPLEANVTLKQNGRTVQSWTGMKYIKDLQVGRYELECTASGYGAQTKRITIEENSSVVLDVKLEKGETVTDIDGNVYKTVRIGSQVWMAENLKVTRYRNGDAIPNVTSPSKWENLSSGARCAYDNKRSNAKIYGLLYNWYAVNDRRHIAAQGWHVPTDKEWKQLEKYLGMSSPEANDAGWRGTDEGGKLKERGTAHWKSPNTGATNESGFSALPGGYRNYLGTFLGIGGYGFWWSATANSSTNAWYRTLGYSYSDVYRYGYDKRSGFSLRLVRD